MSVATRIAAAVIAEAANIDYRIRKGIDTEDQLKRQIESWARVFEGEQVWPVEAMQAVTAHYRKPDAFPIMPGDVIAFCKSQPHWSSRERLLELLDNHAQFPYSRVISELAGREIPEIDADFAEPGLDNEALIARRREYLESHRDELVAEIMMKKIRVMRALN